MSLYRSIHSSLAVLIATITASSSMAAEVQDALPLSGFSARFTILFRSDNPDISLRPAGVKGVSYNVPTWKVDDTFVSKVQTVRDKSQAGDGFDESILDGAMQNRTHNLFEAGESAELSASKAVQDGERVVYTFPDNPWVELSAIYEPDASSGYPSLTFTAVRKKDGWLSIGYDGAPSADDAQAQEGWQPLIWTERRFPALPYLTPAHMCPLPSAFIRIDGVLYGVVAAPSELPFQPLPLFDNSRFGVALRKNDGKLSPMIFAPMLGGKGSYGKAGETIVFKLHLVRLQSDVAGGFEAVAKQLYGFKDLRHNALGPLNEALDNILDYAMSDFANWNEELRGCGYSTDVPGAVKNVSALNPLEMAMLTGRRDIFETRAKPILEYMLSREKYLFSLDPKEKIQSPSRALNGPCATLSELATLSVTSSGATPVYYEQALETYAKDRVLNLDEVSKGKTWWNALYLYRASGDAKWLRTAMEGADTYIAARVDTPATAFDDPDSQGFFFWTGFVPRWTDLLMLYESSGEKRYLDAAHRAARLNMLFVWMCPEIPDESVRVNEGGKAPVYAYLGKRGYPAMDAAEEEVPAWRLSEIGLTPESSGTATGHRGIFMANYAPWLLRLSALTGDTFMHDIARSAVIGRYRNFPGYHINTARTTVYEQADYPLHPHERMSYNSMHYNHIWPMASMLADYMVGDAWARSGGKVDFPSEYIEAYAYLQSRFYGHAKGNVYDLRNMQPWFPRHLLLEPSPEINAFAAYNEGGVAIILCNQSFDEVTTSITPNPAIFSTLPPNAAVRRWQNNIRIQDTQLSVSGAAIVIPAQGISVIYIEGAVPQAGWMQSGHKEPTVKGSVINFEPGNASAMILGIGDVETWGYVYLRDDDGKLASAMLEVTQGKITRYLKDKTFPFEFSFSVDPTQEPASICLYIVSTDGKTIVSKPVSLPLRQ